MTLRIERAMVFGALGLGMLGIANVFYSASVAAAATQPEGAVRAYRVTHISLAVTAACVLFLAWRLAAFVRRAKK